MSLLLRLLRPAWAMGRMLLGFTTCTFRSAPNSVNLHRGGEE